MRGIINTMYIYISDNESGTFHIFKEFLYINQSKKKKNQI